MYTISAPNGRSVTVPILDKCQACDNDAPHIDLTAGTFQALGYDLSQGVIRGVTFGPAVSSLFCKLILLWWGFVDLEGVGLGELWVAL